MIFWDQFQVSAQFLAILEWFKFEKEKHILKFNFSEKLPKIFMWVNKMILQVFSAKLMSVRECRHFNNAFGRKTNFFIIYRICLSILFLTILSRKFWHDFADYHSPKHLPNDRASSGKSDFDFSQISLKSAIGGSESSISE